MQSFYNGLTGMFNFSRALDNVSNNISNMNTPGFKGSDVFMRSLSNGDSSYGSVIVGTSTRSDTGDLRQTSNSTDLAISGEGYFVLQNQNGETFYTRAGQFEFNKDNILVDRATGYFVMGVSAQNQLEQINISEYKSIPATPTTQINFTGNLLSTTLATAPYTVTNINIFDARGGSHKVSAEFTKSATAADTWTVAIKDSSPAPLATFDIQFGVNGTPTTGTVSRSITFDGVAQTINFNPGAVGSIAGLTQNSNPSNAVVSVKDGHDVIGTRKTFIDEDGIVQFEYTDSEKKSGQQVALAKFANPSVLESSSKGLYRTSVVNSPEINKPNKGGLGTIQNGRVEMSNVDLTQEFADILIIQRGYQASSRVMSVANDLLDQLYNNTRTK